MGDDLCRRRLKKLFGLNRDIMIRSFALLAAFTLVTRIGTSFGPVTLAANAWLMTIFLVAGYYLDGLATAAEQLTGRSIGAGYRPAFDRVLRMTGPLVARPRRIDHARPARFRQTPW